jgi:cytochrome c553
MKHVLNFGLAALCALFLAQSPLAAQPKKSAKSMIERGKWLVNLGGCDHCHSPKVFGPMGPAPDTTQLLSGHPAMPKAPEIPAGVLAPDKWGVLVTNDLTAWAGPWGVSFAKNLTPDVATGIGSWTEAMFIKALRTGKDMGEGRPILPPMPWQNIGQLSDADLKAIFAYLRSLKPIANAVPDPIPPAQK